jgi:(p)ppGpp synthase/HD superfamily hydrolase
MTTKENNIIVIAKHLATEAHKGQLRWDKKTPYISHPAAVVDAITKRSFDNMLIKEQAIAAAWLHDVLEDTETTVTDLLNAGIPRNVIEQVIILTKAKRELYLSYILNIKINPIARIVKIADIEHNMSCFESPKGSLYDKYSLALYILESNN